MNTQLLKQKSASFNSPHSLKRTIIRNTCLLSLFLSVAFSALNFLTAYMIEDHFFRQLLLEEKHYLQAQFTNQNIQLNQPHNIKPRQSFMLLYDHIEQAPADLLKAYRNQPKQNEYRGEQGRHYHVIALKAQQKILVSEVSSYLTVRQLMSDLFIGLSLLSFVMFIIALAVSTFMAKRATAPLTKLANLLTHTTPENLPSEFSAQYPNNEIGLLANKLEQAMTRIQHFIEREQHFTRDASHELRTPVTIIKNALELLNQQGIQAEQKTYIERISLANNQMEQTINTLLSLAREQHQPNSAQSIALLPCIEQAIVDQSHLLNHKNIELNLKVTSSAQVQCSTTVLQILLNNLLGNAFAYTEFGHIDISFTENTLTISDSGGGLEQEIQNSALDNLVKGKNSQGFGIGLSLVKRLCESYQLTLNLSSTQQGVTIAISFPENNNNSALHI